MENIHLTIHLGEDAERLLRFIARQLAANLEGKEEIMATLDEILEVVAAEGTKLDSLNVLVDGIRQQLADVLAGVTLPPGVQAQIDQVFTNIQANVAKVDEAIAENTPSEPGPSVA